MTFSSAEKVTCAIKKCITDEMVENGILSDVETFVPSYRLEEPMDLPAVWLFEHPTTLKGKLGFNGCIDLTTPFEFVCVEYDEDIETSEIKGKNLAWRVGQSIFKNKNQLQSNQRVFNDIRFQTLYPVGEVQIQGKLNKIPATSIILEFDYAAELIPMPPIEDFKEVEVDVDTELVDADYIPINQRL